MKRIGQVVVATKGRTVKYAYLLDGMPCLAMRIKAPLAKQLGAFHLIAFDLRSAKACFEFALSETDPRRRLAFLRSGAVQYMRCFTEADGRGVKLEKIPKYVPQEFMGVHEDLEHLRNQLFAHAGVSDYEQSSVNVAIDPETLEFVDIFFGMFSTSFFQEQQVQNFVKICDEILERVRVKREAIQKKMTEVLKHQDFKQWQEIAEDPQEFLEKAEKITVVWEGCP